jgi:hypothetical protein
LGAIGCNFEVFSRKLEANPHLFRHLLSKHYILVELAVGICDAAVGVAEPKTYQILRRVLFSQPSGAKSPEGVSE